MAVPHLANFSVRLARSLCSSSPRTLTHLLSHLSQTNSEASASSSFQSCGRLLAAPAVPTTYVITKRFASSFGLAAAQDVQGEPDVYKVNVVTGNLRGAGTTAPAMIQFIGTEGVSTFYHIGEGEESFERGSSRSFDIPVSKDIGILRRVHIQRAPGSVCELGTGWFLEHVEVQGPHGEYWLFPCHSWLGQSDCGDYHGSLERNLLPCAVTQGEEEEGVEAHPVTVTSAALAIPHPEKVARDKIKGVNKKNFGFGGEDSYFYCHGKNGIFGMGVADGIYMWKEAGIDSGLFSRTLMETALHMIQAGCEDVYKVLSTAARHVESEGVYGSSTCCLMSINMPRGRLQAANLGDSGFLVVGFDPREGNKLRIKFRTTQLEQEFGCPYQLGHHAAANKPEDAELASFPVLKGDVIIMGSDGLLDNVSDSEMLAAVIEFKESGTPNPRSLVQKLAKLAFETSLDKKKSTPYSKAATEAFDMVYSGGKPDDITVLVAALE